MLKLLGRVLNVLLIPILIAAASAVGYHIWHSNTEKAAVDGAAAMNKQVTAERKIPVVLVPAESRAFERRVVVQGNVEAKNSAVVSPRVPGTLDVIFVDEGDRVSAGRTKLFQTDAVKLQKSVDVRKGEVAVARCALREKQASLEQTQVKLEHADLNWRRRKNLFDRKVVSEDELEQYATSLKEAQVQVKHAQSLVDLAAAQLAQAEDSLAMANKDLRDALVLSPIDGVVSVRHQEPGEMGTVGKAVVQIDDLSVVEVSAFLPARCYPEVVQGKAHMRVRVGDIDLGERAITYRSPTVDPRLRVFEVKCEVTSPPEGVAPGAMAEVSVVLERRRAVGVPIQAVQRRQSGRVLFTASGERATSVAVETGIETDGWVELTKGAVEAGTLVVAMGQFLLDDGVAIAVSEEPN